MIEYEYEEENLDDFMIKSSEILVSENNNEEKEIIIESLKQHLSSIFNNQMEMQNFYKTLNLAIFSNNSNQIIHKNCFKLFPIIFSFNPNSCFYYIDYFFISINQSIKEENSKEFSFLGKIFSEIITFLFSEDNKNKYLISKEYSLEENKKYKLYEKIFNFLREKMQFSDKMTQSFGCLFLTELIENCPIIKHQKYLEEVFKLLSKCLEEPGFYCKLDSLNCLISLIFTTEKNFAPYANICLFRVLDYLTDDEWIKRKLSVNIVYTLVFFCKEEILAVKDNIIEFLNVLKEDPVDEIREVCYQTLKILQEKNDEDDELEKNNNNINNQFNEKNNDKNDEDNINNIIIEDKNNIKSIEGIKHEKMEKFINKKNPYNNTTDKKKRIIINRSNIKREDRNKNKSGKNIFQNKNSKINPITDFNINNRTPNRITIKKEAKTEKNKIINILPNENTKNKINKNNKNLIQNQKQKNKISNKMKQENEKQNTIEPNSNNNNNNNDNNNIITDNKTKEKEENIFDKTLSNIIGQLGKIQESQNQFLNMINNLESKLNDNYSEMNERLLTLEKNFSNDNEVKTSLNNSFSKKRNKTKRNSPDPNELKYKFSIGKYNDALIDAKQNEKYLFKLMPLIDKKNITKINNQIIEDMINISNKKLANINSENGRTILSNILSFYLCIIKAKIPLMLISQLNIKDALNNLMNKNNDKLLQIDINNIDAILKSFKI